MYNHQSPRRCFLARTSVFSIAVAFFNLSPLSAEERPPFGEVAPSGHAIPSGRRLVEHRIYVRGPVNASSKIPLAIGSGLVPISSTGDTTVLLALSDRGPNIPVKEAKGRSPERVLFPEPGFNPSLVPLVVRGSDLSHVLSNADPTLEFPLPVGEALPITSPSGEALTGIPSSHEDEIPLGPSLAVLNTTNEELAGIDPEAIAFDPHQKILWIAEEYGPSLLAIDPSTRRIKKRLVPGAGLPEIMKYRARNRGFEGLTYLPSEHLAVILQSPLHNRSTDTREGFVRLLILPSTPNSKDAVVTYPLVLPANAERDSYKIGELVALSNDTFLALEAYKSTDDQKHYHLILLDLSRARAVDSDHLVMDLRTLRAPIQRSLILDFKDFTWDSGKIEGLALINGNRTLIVAKDNDFGITLKGREKGKSGTQTATFKDVPTEFLILEFPRPLEDLIATR
jgi:hypothetical protein